MSGAALALAAALSAEPIPPSDVQWARIPTAEELGRFHPTDTRRMGDARVVLDCRADDAGYLKDCSVIEETPTDRGLGAYALKLSEVFRLTPRTRSGQSTAQRRVRVPILLKAPE